MADPKMPKPPSPDAPATEIVGHMQEKANVVVAPDTGPAPYSLDERKAKQRELAEKARKEAEVQVRANEAAEKLAAQGAKDQKEDGHAVVIEMGLKDYEHYREIAAAKLREASEKAKAGWVGIQKNIAELSEEARDRIFPTESGGRIVEPSLDNVDNWLKQWRKEPGGITLNPVTILERARINGLRKKVEAFASSEIMRNLKEARKYLAMREEQLAGFKRTQKKP